MVEVRGSYVRRLPDGRELYVVPDLPMERLREVATKGLQQPQTAAQLLDLSYGIRGELSVHSSVLREVFLATRDAALKAVDPVNAVKNHVRLEGEILRIGGRTYDLRNYENVYVAGIGKASVQMAQGLQEVLVDRITEGVVNTSYGSSRTVRLDRIRINEVAHQAPDQAGVDGSKEIIALAQKAGERDLFLFVVSGGGSDTFLAPVEPDIEVYKRFISDLKKIIGRIDLINCVRKKVDTVKGGQLARLIFPADGAVLILSDVKGDPLSIIASDPTAPDDSTFPDAARVLEMMDAESGFVPASVREQVRKGVAGEIPETPKEGNPIFSKTQNLLVGNNSMALEAARERLVRGGLGVEVMPEPVDGEADAFADTLVARAEELSKTITKPTVILAGGEVKFRVNPDSTGQGGRGSTLALAVAKRISGTGNIAFMAFGTDGVDYYAGHGGAMSDGSTIKEIAGAGILLDDRVVYGDSYVPLDKINASILCEPTGTNVMDVYMMVVMPRMMHL